MEVIQLTLLHRHVARKDVPLIDPTQVACVGARVDGEVLTLWARHRPTAGEGHVRLRVEGGVGAQRVGKPLALAVHCLHLEIRGGEACKGEVEPSIV